jgi:hypothetical protein
MLRAVAPVCFASRFCAWFPAEIAMTEGELFFMPVVAQPDLNLSLARHKVTGDLYLEVYRTSGAEPETRVTLVRCRR